MAASQLLLLADHIKLSLLERQRAISLDLEPNSHDGEISKSLESLREGLEKLETQNLSVHISSTPYPGRSANRPLAAPPKKHPAFARNTQTSIRNSTAHHHLRPQFQSPTIPP